MGWGDLLGGGDDKYADRLWDWGKDWSYQTQPIWNQLLGQGTDFLANPGGITSNPVFDWAKNQTAGWGTPQNAQDTDAYQLAAGLYSPWEGIEGQDITQMPIYQQIKALYDRQAEPIYGQMMDPMKRGIEAQYGNSMDQILASGATGGGLTSALAAMGGNRANALSDMEKQLRMQDILRQDQMNAAGTQALGGLAQNLYGSNQAMGLGRAQALSNMGLSMDQYQRGQQMTRDTMLAQLLNQLYGGEMNRALALGMSGQNARLGASTSLAGLEGQSGMMGQSSLLSMLGNLGLGVGMSGMFGNAVTADTGMGGDPLSDGFFGGNIGDIGDFGVFGR